MGKTGKNIIAVLLCLLLPVIYAGCAKNNNAKNNNSNVKITIMPRTIQGLLPKAWLLPRQARPPAGQKIITTYRIKSLWKQK